MSQLHQQNVVIVTLFQPGKTPIKKVFDLISYKVKIPNVTFHLTDMDHHVIIEYLKYLTNPVTESAKIPGQLRETIAMEARYKRSQKQ